MSKNEEKRKGIDARSDGKIKIVRWNDNSVVLIGSNAYSVQPIRRAKWRIKKREAKYSATCRYRRKWSRNRWSWSTWPSNIRFEASDLWEKVVLPLVINPTNIAFVYSWWLYLIAFLVKLYRRKISDGSLWVSWSGYQRN